MVVGVLGKSCSGKDTLLSFFDDEFYIIDVDKLGHEALSRNKEEILSFFGPSVLKDNEINRKELSKIVFSDKDSLDKLDNITHPWMVEECRRVAKEEESFGKIVVINCALLERMGLWKLCDVIVYVSSSFEKRVKRAFIRNMTSEDEFRRRDLSQSDIGSSVYTLGKKVITIFNNGSFEDLSRQGKALCDILKKGKF